MIQNLDKRKICKKIEKIAVKYKMNRSLFKLSSYGLELTLPKNMRINNLKSGIINSSCEIDRINKDISKLKQRKKMYTNYRKKNKIELEKMTM